MLVLLYAAALATVAPPPHCTNKCHVGKHGLNALFSSVQSDGCASYAARVVTDNFARECGHVELADALAACAFHTQNPPQCYSHKAAGAIYAATTTIVAVLYLIPLITKCSDESIRWPNAGQPVQT